MTDVEKSEILHKWHVCDVENVAIYKQNLRVFMWRKIEPKSTYVEKNDKYKVCTVDANSSEIYV